MRKPIRWKSYESVCLMDEIFSYLGSFWHHSVSLKIQDLNGTSGVYHHLFISYGGLDGAENESDVIPYGSATPAPPKKKLYMWEESISGHMTSSHDKWSKWTKF